MPRSSSTPSVPSASEYLPAVVLPKSLSERHKAVHHSGILCDQALVEGDDLRFRDTALAG